MKFVEPADGIDGIARAPPSKSVMQRALAIACLARGKSRILNPSFCDDSAAAIGAIRALGAKVSVSGDCVEVEGRGIPGPAGGTIDCIESGLCARMFTPVASLSGGEFTITGKGPLASRPMGMAEKPLVSLGVRFNSSGGKLPVTVRGPLRGGKAEVDGAVSSQFLTGLLIALPVCGADSVIDVAVLKSREYAAMTIKVASCFGVKIINENYERFLIGGNQRYFPGDFTVEGDWSGASFLLVAGAICGMVKVTDLRMDSLQPDRKILGVLEAAGAKVGKGKDFVVAEKPFGQLKSFYFDATDCPDLFPPLAALACACKGRSRIKGAERLAHKESDRASSLVEEFSKMGASLRVDGDYIEIQGGKKLAGGTVDSHNDHRIAMACAVAGLTSEKGVHIEGEDCVSKSYPGFFRDLEGMRR
ncbi:3-phosphoshikimate 1-carboxyvinyltransferase [uncultured archaeon]|nr:3-phosphoshikimate 1-carboxyvinyltransferase [uncultured archaeon]